MDEHRKILAGDASQSLAGQLLIAMPGMEDRRFERSVIYMCAHSDKGAMGIIINKAMETLTFAELLDQLNIETGSIARSLRIQAGGPVDTTRGFVLHSLDYRTDEGTLEVTSNIGLTATVDVLKAIARGEGPWKAMLALGYAGWSPGQLEGEIRANGWLHCPADDELLFSPVLDQKWQRAIGKLGIDPTQLSSTSGNA